MTYVMLLCGCPLSARIAPILQSTRLPSSQSGPLIMHFIIIFPYSVLLNICLQKSAFQISQVCIEWKILVIRRTLSVSTFIHPLTTSAACLIREQVGSQEFPNGQTAFSFQLTTNKHCVHFSGFLIPIFTLEVVKKGGARDSAVGRSSGCCVLSIQGSRFRFHTQLNQTFHLFGSRHWHQN